MTEGEPGAAGQRVVLVTGPSGAGRTTAIRALEDLGYEAIDNLPLAFLPRLVGPDLPPRPLAIGLDMRTRGFSAVAIAEAVAALRGTTGIDAWLLYLDCASGALIRRFSETRRRHPLAPALDAEAGVARELELLAPVREQADLLLDTSDLSPHELKAELGRWFAVETGQGLAVLIESFSFKRGIPRGLDMMFDVRFLANPYWEPALRALDGRDTAVAGFILGDPRFAGFFGRLVDFVLHLLPAYRDEGKAHLSIGIGCTGGRHRSVFVAAEAARRLELSGWRVNIRHRDVGRTGAGSAGNRSGSG